MGSTPTHGTILWRYIVNDKEKQIEFLIHSKSVMISYLRTKMDEHDWHGVCDAANDIRVIEAKLEVLSQINT